MTLSGVSSHHSVVTKQTGKQKATLGYNPNARKAPYIINYSRNSVNIHKGQSMLRKLFGR